MKKILGLILCCSLSSCANFGKRTARTLDGYVISLPKCQRAIDYSGSKFSFGGLSAEKKKVASGEWQTVFRDTKPLIEALDSSQYRTCGNLCTIASSYTLAEFKREEASVRASQQKLDQLAILVASENKDALKRFVDIYFFPVSDKYYEQQMPKPTDSESENLDTENPTLVAKTAETQQAYQIADIDATSAQSIMGH